MPLSITTFKGEFNKDGNLINWLNKTDDEVATYVFESSCDGVIFTQAATIQANGNKAYSYTHKSTCSNSTYYRLKAINKLGKIDYSKIIKLAAIDDIHFKTSPNSITAGKLIIELFSIGKKH